MKKQRSISTQLLINAMIILSLVLIGQKSSAQEKVINNNIKLSFENPGKFQLDYERALNSHSSFSIGIQGYTLTKSQNREGLPDIKLTNDWGNKNNLPYNSSDISKAKTSSQGYSINAEYRFYFYSNQKSLNGFYLAPNGRWGKHQLSHKEFFPGPYNQNPDFEKGTEHVTSIAYGLKLGYKKDGKIST